jgi:hypothetical protein
MGDWFKECQIFTHVPVEQHRQSINTQIPIVNNIVEKDWLFSKQYWDNWIFTCMEIKLNSFLRPYTKLIQSRLNTSMQDTKL